MALGLPYQRLAESGSPTAAQRVAASKLRRDKGANRVSTDLLADGRLRIHLLDRSEIITAIYYAAPDGTTTEEGS